MVQIEPFNICPITFKVATITKIRLTKETNVYQTIHP